MSRLFPSRFCLTGLLASLPALGLAAQAAQGGYLAGELGAMDADTATAQAVQAPNLLPTLLNVLFSLAFVVGLVLLAYWLLLKWRAKQGLAVGPRAGLIRILERHFIDGKHGIAVVEVGDSILTLGLGDDVTLLGEVGEPAAVERLRQMAPLPLSVMGFKEQLERVGLKLRKEEWSLAKRDLREQSDELKAQAERVRGPKGGAK